MLCASAPTGLRAGQSNVTAMTVVDDTYTGHVEPQHRGGRTLPGATIMKMSVGPMDNNAYLMTCSRHRGVTADRRRPTTPTP